MWVNFNANCSLYLILFHFQAVQKKGGKPKGRKNKKDIKKINLDCTHPVEDGIMDVANFVSKLHCSVPKNLFDKGKIKCNIIANLKGSL